MTAPSDPTGGMEPIRQIAHQMEEERRKAAGIDLRALIAECDASPPDTDGSDTRMLIDPRVLAEIARDARRFQWLLARHGETEADPDTPNVWLHFIGWSGEVRTADIRAAIDADMGEAR